MYQRTFFPSDYRWEAILEGWEPLSGLRPRSDRTWTVIDSSKPSSICILIINRLCTALLHHITRHKQSSRPPLTSRCPIKLILTRTQHSSSSKQQKTERERNKNERSSKFGHLPTDYHSGVCRHRIMSQGERRQTHTCWSGSSQISSDREISFLMKRFFAAFDLCFSPPTIVSSLSFGSLATTSHSRSRGVRPYKHFLFFRRGGTSEGGGCMRMVDRQMRRRENERERERRRVEESNSSVSQFRSAQFVVRCADIFSPSGTHHPHHVSSTDCSTDSVESSSDRHDENGQAVHLAIGLVTFAFVVSVGSFSHRSDHPTQSIATTPSEILSEYGGLSLLDSTASHVASAYPSSLAGCHSLLIEFADQLLVQFPQLELVQFEFSSSLALVALSNTDHPGSIVFSSERVLEANGGQMVERQRTFIQFIRFGDPSLQTLPLSQLYQPALVDPSGLLHGETSTYLSHL